MFFLEKLMHCGKKYVKCAGVYGVNHILTDNVYLTFPSWNQYCLGLDLTTSTVSFSVNGNMTATALPIPSLSTTSSIILNSKLVMTSEMFSFVNIHSLALAKVDPAAVGSALAWLAADWSNPNSGTNPVTSWAKAEILGIDGRRLLVVPAVLNFADAVTTCTNLGQGTLVDPANLLDWKALLGLAAGQLGPNWTDPLAMWIPYTSTTGKGGSFSSVYTAGKAMSGLLWSPGEPSAGEACVHCSAAGCEDDPCTLEMAVHVCEFLTSRPLLQLRGLCEKSSIGRKLKILIRF